MALHSELPIYKVAYDLLALVLQITRNMPRDVKQQVGTALRDECVQITVLIFRANVAREKAPHLSEVIERLQVAELLLRLSHDLHRVVIDRMALPTNPPISLTLLGVTALKVWDAPGWAWGVAGTLLSLLWIVAVVAIVRETEKMPQGFGEESK